MWITTRLLDDEPAETGTGQPSNPPAESNPPAPAASPATNVAPAAAAVLDGTRSERELKLQEDLDRERESRKKDQTKLAQLEDQLSRRNSPAPAATEDHNEEDEEFEL